MKKITSKDCVIYITNWIKKNPTALSYDDYAKKLFDTKEGFVNDGTSTKHWKRAGKITKNCETLRVYRHECSVYDITNVIILHEKNGEIINIEHGHYTLFVGDNKYFEKIDWGI
jgi:hypothetical protein